MEQLRAIFLWTLAISVAVVIAGIATGVMTIRNTPIPPRSVLSMPASLAPGER